MNNSQILTLLLWGLGTCVTGFLFLAGWILKATSSLTSTIKTMTSEIEKKVSFGDLNKTMATTNTLLQNIKDAICGDFKQPGLLHKAQDNLDRISTLEVRCKKTHEPKDPLTRTEK